MTLFEQMNQTVRFLFFWMLICVGAISSAQSDSTQRDDSTNVEYVEIDSIALRYVVFLIDTLPELADSIFNALKTKKFDQLLPYTPTAEMLKEQMDSMDLKQLQRLATVKQQYLEHNLRKQHIRMLKDAKVMRFNFRRMELIKQRIRIKEHETGVRYGEITYLCQSGKHKAYVAFLAIEVVDRWFIGDELRIVPLD